jgi:hypothetical protein
MRSYGLPLCLMMLLLAANWGCKKPAPAPLSVRVTRLTVSDVAGAGPGGADALRAAVQRGLQRAGVPVAESASPSQPGDFQLRMQLQIEDAPPQRTLRLLCAGLLSARRSALLADKDPSDPKDAPEPELTKLEHVGLAEKTFASEPDPAAVAALVRRLVEDSAHTLGQQLLLLGSESRALLALISRADADPELRKTAIQIVGRRRERLAVPVLIALIKERDRDKDPLHEGDGSDAEQRRQRAVHRLLRDTAIGALVEIGDRSAVRPLLDSVAFRDRVEMGKLVEAVASLGGEDALRYLQFVRTSHPEKEIRSEAEDALRRLEQRSQDAGTAAAP